MFLPKMVILQYKILIFYHKTLDKASIMYYLCTRGSLSSQFRY